MLLIPKLLTYLLLISLMPILSMVSIRSVVAATSITAELIPPQPIVGQPVKLRVQTWLVDATGAPDRAQPADMTDYPFDVRLYQANEFAGTFAAASEGVPITLEQVDRFTWHAMISFPAAGPWVIVFRNWYPPLPQAPPPRHAPAALEVVVHPAPAQLPATNTGTDSPRSRILLVALSSIALFGGLVVRHICTHNSRA